MRPITCLAFIIATTLSALCPALVFESRCESADPWNFIDYVGDGQIVPTQDLSCPPGFGPQVLHITGKVIIGMPKEAALRNGTVVALYRENDPRANDADGILLFRANYGMNVSVEHNTKVERAHVWLEQDNDSGFLYHAINADGEESTLAERPGYGLVTDPWNTTRWIWQKVQMDGGRIRAKFWPAQMPEPTEWALEADYDGPGERFGIRINSGDINLAYYAADTADIPIAPPSAYLFFPYTQATQAGQLPFTLYTNASSDETRVFEVTAADQTGECGRGTFEAEIPAGPGVHPFILTAKQGSTTPEEGPQIALTREPGPGLCTVSVTAGDEASSAQRSFEILDMKGFTTRLDEISALIAVLTNALDACETRGGHENAIAVIRDAAQAHLDRARGLFEAGQTDEADWTLRFAVEALSELSGYKGAWLKAMAPNVDLAAFPPVFTETRGIDPNPEHGVVDIYSSQYLMHFGTPRLDAQSFVMGGTYDLVIPWTVEGASPDRDFAFSVSLMSPLGDRTPATAEQGVDTPTSAWKPGQTYEQHVTLNVTPENPEGLRPLGASVVEDEYHYLLVSVTDPKTGAHLILGNEPGPQPSRIGFTYRAEDVYISSTPIEIRAFAPAPGPVGAERHDTAALRNTGGTPQVCEVLLTVSTDTERTVYQEARRVMIEPQGTANVDFAWTPATAGGLTARIRVLRKGATVTEAKRTITVAAPEGYDFRVTKANHVEAANGRFFTPVTVTAGQGPVSVQIKAGERVVGNAQSSGGSVEVQAEPWFGYYDVLVDLGDFRYDERLVATVVETQGCALLVNGEPFIVKGTNVHGMDGRSRPRTETMMRVMRGLGFNAWRGDYPAPWQIEMAYDLNTAYTVLAPFSCASTAEVFGRQDGPPMATARELTRLFIQRYKDLPGALLWNSCNEIGEESVDFLLSQYPLYKAFDPCSRPVHYANLYGQDYWQGQDLMGTNVYFGEGQTAASRHPVIERTLGIAREAGIPLCFCEYNSYLGAVQTTGADAMRNLFDWGVEQGMCGGFQYMKGDSTSHPGVFDAGYNTHKVHNEAIIEVFADATIEVAEARPDAEGDAEIDDESGDEGDAESDAESDATIDLCITNRRPFTLRETTLTLTCAGGGVEPMNLGEIKPHAKRIIAVPLPKDTPGPTVAITGALDFTTHFGFKSTVAVEIFVTP